MAFFDSEDTQRDDRGSPFTAAMGVAQLLDSPVQAEVSNMPSHVSSDVSRDTDFMDVLNVFMSKISADVSLQTGKIRVLENELTLLQEKKAALEKIRSLWKPSTDLHAVGVGAQAVRDV